MPVSKGIKEIIMGDAMYLSGNEFTSKQAHSLMGQNAIVISTGTCLSRMVKSGILKKRDACESGHHLVFYKASATPLPLTIEERILASKPYLSGNRFSSATMQSYLKDCSKGGINFAITKLKASGDIAFVMKAATGRGVNENIYIKASKVTSWLTKPWVSEPSPTDCTPVMC